MKCTLSSHLLQSKSETVLKRFHVIPSDYDLHTQPSYPVLLTQLRDQLLIPPPKEPPLPELQAPYYLGLKNRERHPGLPTPPPTPPPADPRFVELYPTVCDDSEVREVGTPEPKGLGFDLGMENIAKASSDTLKSIRPTDKPLKAVSDTGPPRSTLSVGKVKSGGKDRHSRAVPGAVAIQMSRVNLKWMDYLEFLSVFK